MTDARRFPTYDETRMSAPLVTCERCRRAFYMAPPRPICIECRRELERLAARGGSNGVLANRETERGSVLAANAPAVPAAASPAPALESEGEELDTFGQWYLGDLDVDNPQAG